MNMEAKYMGTLEHFMSVLTNNINTIEEMHDGSDILHLLEEEQEYAIKLGTVIESRIGEGTDAVKKLEELCEVVYHIGEKVGRSDYDEELDTLKALIKEVEELCIGLHMHREVAIFPYRMKYWDGIKDLWKSACDDEYTDVFLIPVPYYDKNPDGELGECHYEGLSVDCGVDINDYNEYKLDERYPDVIIIQNVQENTNYALSVHPDYYAENLKKYTPNLIYVSPYDVNISGNVDERSLYNLRYYVTVPGMVYVDRIIVKNQEIRNIYINALTDFIGEETRQIWDKKVDTAISMQQSFWGVTDVSTEDGISDAGIILPEEWKAYMLKDDGSRKKIILFATTISTVLNNREEMIDKMRRIFATFVENKDNIAVIWKPDDNIGKLEEYEPKLWKEYKDIAEEFKRCGIGVYDDLYDDSMAVNIADAYYGDPCVTATGLRRRGKPVMIMNAEV